MSRPGRRSGRAGRELLAVEGETRAERTARRLAGELEAFAGAVERLGARPEGITRLLELASLATLHAVSLEQLTSSRPRALRRAA